jgi:hypothetical protein
MADTYKQKRCKHGWVDVSQCEQCKLERELSAAIAERDKAVDEAAKMAARYEEQCAKLAAEVREREILTDRVRGLTIKAECSYSSRERCKKQLAAMRDALVETVEMLSTLHVPEKNCSCHINPPCYDCTENEALRRAIAIAQSALDEVGK